MRVRARAAIAAIISTTVVVSTTAASSTTAAGSVPSSTGPTTGVVSTSSTTEVAGRALGFDNTKVPTSIGHGGAISTVDPVASQVGLRVLRRGGNAVDAAVAAAAALGVTGPFSAGIGGGGYFVFYNARTGKVRTIDGRETAPAAIPSETAFIDPATGEPYNFSPELVTSGLSVGVPGTLRTWKRALKRWGSISLAKALRPATRVARRGFEVDATFRGQVEQNEVRFKAFTSTRRLYFRGGDAPAVGSIFRNPDQASTYRLIARKGLRVFYRGRLAHEIVHAVRRPPKTDFTDLPVPPGYMRASDLARYRPIVRRPTHIDYRGLDVYGMAPSSSGGSTVGEALNILETFHLRGMDDIAALHRYLSAGELAFADRGAYVGDPAYVDVPLRDLLSDRYARERACLIDPDHTLTPIPTDAGDVTSYDGVCDDTAREAAPAEDTENTSTTNLTVADRWGNVVEYTLTIEQTGGSGIVVPGRGFLLNNELTDFTTVYDPEDPNRVQPGKRPRSSMSPTIVLRHGKPFLALGSPGGSTIITTVLQMLFNRLDRGMTIVEAIKAPRSSPRNSSSGIGSEPGFLAAYETGLEALGHDVILYVDPYTGTHEIGAATAIEFGRHGRMTAVSEPARRGGGSALVVHKKR
jgi:gamma-glutamyltranspeptidase / glutathione hydrolase